MKTRIGGFNWIKKTTIRLTRDKSTSTSRVFYHGDPSRDNNFWVYPREKALITPRWDTYNADDLCNNYTYVETIAFGIWAYRCNGHGTASGGGLSQDQAQFSTSTSRVFYHGDPSRNNNFWVYPREKALITRRWDTYNADDLCNNYTYVETIAFGIRAYRCNGHGTASGGGLSQDQAQFCTRKKG
ncbi:unnamed protein product [Rotaria sp. Silwood1]|nr:unnamed protein product [Rotaria sp. Silwood1]